MCGLGSHFGLSHRCQDGSVDKRCSGGVRTVSTPKHASHVEDEPDWSPDSPFHATASEVLGVAERLDSSDDRHRFSLWADSIFNQVLKSSSSTSPEWSTRVSLARGRCWLNMASSKLEEYESCMERGDETILTSPQVAETREELASGSSFLLTLENIPSESPLSHRFL